MGNGEKTKYSEEELKEFELLILDKLEKATTEINYIRQSIAKTGGSGTESSFSNVKTLEDGAETAEKESLNHLAGRQEKFITNLKNALIRIKNGTYGICKESGRLISKARLKAVPHTTLSIDSKLKQDS